MRDPLFSVHTTDSGSVCLYLEEQEACIDVVEDVLDFNSLDDLDALKGASSASLKEDGVVEALDRARNNLPEMALKIAIMTEDEAFNLCQDIITSIKKRRLFNADEMASKVAKLRLVE
jgi:hypothetical protein